MDIHYFQWEENVHRLNTEFACFLKFSHFSFSQEKPKMWKLKRKFLFLILCVIIVLWRVLLRREHLDYQRADEETVHRCQQFKILPSSYSPSGWTNMTS